MKPRRIIWKLPTQPTDAKNKEMSYAFVCAHNKRNTYNPTSIFHNFIVILANNSKLHLVIEQHVMVEKTNLTGK